MLIKCRLVPINADKWVVGTEKNNIPICNRIKTDYKN